MKSGASSTQLTFHWPEREGFSWLLFGFVLLSFAAHAASFFLFQVVYPQRATLPRRAPQLHLLAGATPEERAMIEWIDAADPSLVAGANSVTPAHLLDVEYRASFATPRTAPRGVAEERSGVQFPAVKSALAIIRSADPSSPVLAPTPPPQPTQVRFSAALAGRPLAQEPHLVPAVKATAPLEPSRYLIGVSDRGEVRFVFLQSSSGDPALDAEGATRLAGTAFAPDPASITWAHAIITWGGDAYSTEIKNLKSP